MFVSRVIVQLADEHCAGNSIDSSSVQQEMADETVLEVVADIVGWGYFLAWTVSFLPQIYENWRRKSVVGFSFDMLTYFMLSYITYLIYNVAVYFDKDIQKSIMKQSHQSSPVKLNDVVFAIVAFLCTSYQCLQCALYDRGSQTVHLSTWLLCALCILAGAVLAALAAFNVVSFIFVLLYCGYVKMCVSFFTYAPQVWLNYRRKCTEGFHIGGVLLDFSGGVLSLLQQDISCVIDHSIEQLTGNIPKMALAVVTLVFNVILIIQHYVLYMGNVPLEVLAESKPLLGESSNSSKYFSINVDSETDEICVNGGDSNKSILLTASHGSHEKII